MDSFTRELMRLYLLLVMSCACIIQGQSYTFHDGMALPVGSLIGVPTVAIYINPDNYPDPQVFDDFRFMRDRRLNHEWENTEAASSAATITPTYLAFGYGKHACPGISYAVRKIKIVFAKLLLEYEMRWPAPVETPLHPCRSVAYSR